MKIIVFATDGYNASNILQVSDSEPDRSAYMEGLGVPGTHLLSGTWAQNGSIETVMHQTAQVILSHIVDAATHYTPQLRLEEMYRILEIEMNMRMLV